MAENSWCYNCDVGGDAVAIDQREWNFVRGVLSHGDRTLDGILYVQNQTDPVTTNGLNGLAAVSNPAGSTVRAASGVALVNGYVWWSDGDVDFSFTGGQANATDLLVLRSTPATGLVRLARVQAAAPATTATVTQTAATWEIAIAEVLLDGSGNFSALTDVRKLALPKGAVIPLGTANGTGASGTITFSGIPSQLFSNLRIELSARSDNAVGTANNLELTLNNDGGANYNRNAILGQNATVTHSANIGTTAINIGQVTNAGGAASTADGFVINILGYNEALYTPVLASGMTANAGTAATVATWEVRGWWLNTTAVNRVDLNLTPGGNFTTTSQFTIYGIA